MIYSKKNVLISIFFFFIYCHTYPINTQNNSNSSISASNNLFSTIQSYSQQIKQSVTNKCSKQYNAWFKKKIKKDKNDNLLRFIRQLISGQIGEKVLYAIDCPNLDIAEAAFTLLKECWPWKREHTFLIPNLDNNIGESVFIEKLGTDIMKTIEIEHITRRDYISKHIDEQFFPIILECIKRCILLQSNADLAGLFNEVHHLRNRVIKNGRKTILIDNICLAITEKFYLDPLIKLFHTVKHAPTLKEAENAFSEIERRMKQEQAKGADTTKYSSLSSDHLKKPLYIFLTTIKNKFYDEK